MNFLAHYYFARGIDNPAFAAGTTLPDLIGQVERGARPRFDGAYPTFESVSADPLHAGAQHHVLLDRVWHTSRWFASAASSASRQLKSMEWDLDGERRPPRRFFLAHIAVELLLDRHLILDRPNLAEGYYRLLERIEPEELAASAAAWVSPDWLSAEFQQSLQRIYAMFVESRYLLQYQSFEGVTEGLRRVLIRAQQWPREEALPDSLHPHLERLAAEIAPRFADLEIEMKGVTVARPLTADPATEK